MDVAELQLKAEASQIDKATQSLDKLDAASVKTEKSTTKLNRQNQEAAASYNKMTKELMQYAGGFTTVATAVAGLRASINIIKEFTYSMSQVAAVSGATGAELQMMTDAARRMGATTSFSAGEAADALMYLAQGGFTASGAVEALPGVLDLAKASSMGLAEAASITTNVLSGFGIETANTGQAVDIMAAISARSNTDVMQLGEAIGYVGPVAAAMGVSLGDASAAMGVLSDAGIQSSAAGTGLRRVLSSLANPTKDSAAVIRSLGLTLEEVNPATNSLTDVIDRLASTGMSAADALTIFGDRGGPAILALVAENERVRELADQMKNVDGEAKRMADTMGDNLTGDIDELTSTLEELVLALGAAGVTTGLRTVTQGLTEFVGAIPWVITQVQKLHGTFGLLTGAVNPLGNLLFSFLGEAKKGYYDLAEEAETLKGKIEELNALDFYYGDKQKKIDEYKKKLAEIEKEMNQLINLTGQSTTAGERATKMHDEWNKRLATTNKLVNDTGLELAATNKAMQTRDMEKAAEEAKEFAKSLDELKKASNPLQAEVNQLTEEYKLMQRAMKEGKATAEDWAAFMDYALPEVVVEAKKLKEGIKKVKEEQDAMTISFQRGIERMRDGVGDFFKDMVTEGEFSFDKLGDMFLDMIAEMVATAAANKIFLGLGLVGANGEATLGSTAKSMMGGGDISTVLSEGLSSGFSSLANGFGSSMSGLYGGAAKGLRGIGMDSAANFADGQAGIYGQGGMTSVAYGAANIGAGYLGSWAGGKVFGESEEAGTGATVGGAIGSIWGPIGTAVGSFIGSAIGDMFKKGVGNNAAGADFNLATGEITSKTWGNNGSDPGNVTGSKSIAQMLLDFSKSIGGSDFAGNITMGSKKGITFDGKQYGQNADLLVKDAFHKIIEHATTLDDRLKPLILNFDGTNDQIAQLTTGLSTLTANAGTLSDRTVTLLSNFTGSAEEMLQFATGLTAIETLLTKNPVAVALGDIQTAQEAASRGIMGVYDDQISKVNELMYAYTGTAQQTTDLSNALYNSQQMAYQMALAMGQVRQEMSGMIAMSAKTIRESVMTDKQLFDKREKERNQLQKDLSTATDASKLKDTLAQIDKLNTQLFQSLKDPTTAQAEQYAVYAEKSLDIANTRLDQLQDTLEQSQKDQIDRVGALLQSNAEKQSQSVNQFADAVDKLTDALNTNKGSSEDIAL